MARLTAEMLATSIRMELLRIALAYSKGELPLSEVLEDAGRLEDFVFGDQPHNTESALLNLNEVRARGKA